MAAASRHLSGTLKRSHTIANPKPAFCTPFAPALSNMCVCGSDESLTISRLANCWIISTVPPGLALPASPLHSRSSPRGFMLERVVPLQAKRRNIARARPPESGGRWLYGRHPVEAALANPERRWRRLAVLAGQEDEG